MFDEIRDYRRIYSIRSVLGVGSNKRWMSCPMPQHRRSSDKVSTPSFSIYYDRDGVERWKCHGNCGLYGDVIDLVGYLNISGYNPKNISSVLRAVAILSHRHEMTMVEMKPRRDLLKPDAWEEYVPPGIEVFRFARRRGLEKKTLKRFRVGQKGSYMSMPCFEEERLVGIKFRYIGRDEKQLRFFTEKGGRKGLYNYDDVAWTKKRVLIVKGEIPVMLLSQNGILSCAPTAGEGSLATEYAPVLGLSKKRVVVGDNDPDPEVRTRMQERARARANALHAELQFPPEGYKDIDEWILDDFFSLGIIEEWLE